MKPTASSPTPAAPSRRFALFPSFANAVRAGTCLLVATLGIAATANTALASGVPEYLPMGPFMNESRGDFRMLYSEPWHTLRISPKTSLEIGAIFTPVPNYTLSRILGQGWQLPVLEATALPINDREYEMIFPSGYRERLERTKIPNQLRGNGWIATLNGRDLVAKSPCGSELRYQAGRLKMWKTPDGMEVLFNQDAKGGYSVTAGKTVVLSLKLAYDPATTQKIYHLNLQGGKHAVLRFGTRPVLIKTSEKDTFGRLKEKKQNTATLISVQWDGEPEKKYDFATNEMNVAGELFKWDTNSANLLSDKGISYSFRNIRGIKCIQARYPNGQTSLEGDDNRGTYISQVPGGEIEIQEYITNFSSANKKYSGQVRRVFVLKNGKEELIRQHWYDENGKDKKFLTKTDNKSTLYEYLENEIVAKDVDSKKLLFRKKYDLQKRIIELQVEGKTYKFSYPASEPVVAVTQISEKGTLVQNFPVETFQEFLKKL